MTIAVHIRFTDDTTDPAINSHYQCLLLLATKYPGHHFIFIFDKTYPPGLITQKNITALLLPPQIKNPLLQHYWYNFKIPGLLNKYNADHFISNGPVCSLRTNIAQTMMLNDLSFLDKKNLYTAGEVRYIKKYFKKFIVKATTIAVTNQQVRNVLAGMYPLIIDKIRLIGYGIKDVSVLPEYEAQENSRNKYADGKSYFLAFITDVTIQHTIILLKAFSAFKKRQLSNMQLILLVSSTQKEGFIPDFHLYKYRDDVKIIIPANGQEEQEIIAAAYTAVYLPAINMLETKGLTVLANNVPLLTIENDFCKSLYHEAALYSPADEKKLAERMMLLYKDENLRNNLLHAGRSIAAAYTWELMAGKLALSLLDTATQTA
ncbi:hypothetical protein BH11BAC4_BH11BAC4_25840 [soil metagenome]